MKYFIFGIFFVCVTNLHADLNTEIQYGRAMQEAQQGNWENAHSRLNQLVTDNPERADILYDSGVAAYRLKNFESAQAYFKHAIELDQQGTATDLKERAHFNLGNTYVATKQLPQAIEEYEKVLDINPANQAAQDNLRIAKQMLEQEKQKQKQEEEKQKKKDQQKKDQEKKDQQQKDQGQGDKSDKKDKNSQDQNDQGDDQDGNKDQQKDKQDQNKSGEQGQSEKNKSENGQEQGEQSPQEDDNSGSDQEEKEGDEKDQSEQSKQGNKEDQEREGDKKPQRGLDNKQSEQKQNGKDQDEHGTEPSKDMSEKELDAAHGTQDQEKKQGAQQGHADASESAFDGQKEKEMDPHEQWIAGIMKQQEKSDAQANKAFIRQEINKGGSRQHGQKNW